MNVIAGKGGSEDRGASGVRAEFSVETLQAAQEFVEALASHITALHRECHALSSLLRSYRRRDPSARGKVSPIRRE